MPEESSVENQEKTERLKKLLLSLTPEEKEWLMLFIKPFRKHVTDIYVTNYCDDPDGDDIIGHGLVIKTNLGIGHTIELPMDMFAHF